MTRKELANQVYGLMLREAGLLKKPQQIWQAIAETDDNSLLDEYEKLIDRNYSLNVFTNTHR